MKTLLVIVCILLTGCATKEPATDSIMKAGLLDGAIKSANAPLFKLVCPVSGCIIGSLEIGNPNGGAQLAEAVRVVMTPQVSASERIWLSVIDKGFTALGIGLVTNGVKSFASSMFGSQTAIATTGFGSLQQLGSNGFGANAVIASQIPQPGAVTTTNTSTVNTTTNTSTSLTASGAGSAVASGGNASGNNPISTTTTTTNPSRVCTIGPTGIQTCTGG